MITELRDYQVDALTALRQSIGSGVKRIMLQAPTGAGKTAIAAAIVEGAMAKKNRMAFVVPAISLVDQTIQVFWEEGIRDVGVIQANHELTDWSKPVQVCSIQTLQSRRVFPEAQVVVIDEAHVLFKHHQKWMTDPAWEKVPFIGLSATPWAKGLGKLFQSLLIVSTTKELIEQGHLCKFRVFATGHPDLKNVKIIAGDYHEGQLSDAMQHGTLTADIVSTWLKHWNKDKTLCFGVDCAHAKALQERFEQAGVSCGYQDAQTPMSEREEIKRKFHRGELRIISNVATLTMGIDYDVRCLILARPTKSEMLYTQIIGRALRNADGKDAALILDHSDTTQRLGFVTDIHHERLDGGKNDKADAPPPERRIPLPKECPQCAVLKPPRTPICPNCGFQTQVVNGVHEEDGELVEITDLSKVSKKKPKHEWTMDEKAQFYSELKAYGIKYGRKGGWAAHSFKDKFGVWPDWTLKNVAPSAYPSMMVVQWVRSRNIAWAKSKKAAEESASHA